MATRRLGDIAFTRAGDKGDVSDVTVFAPDRQVYELLVDQLTVARVAACYATVADGPVMRYEVPNVLALKFVLHGALGGGGPSSLRADNLGKAMGGPILRLTVEVGDEPGARLPRGEPGRDPYAGAAWVVRGEGSAHNGA